MADLLREFTNAMDDYRRMCRVLDQVVQPNWLTIAVIGLAENRYTALETIQTNFTRLIDEFVNRLPTNDEEDPILMINGEAGYRWRDEEKLTVKNAIQVYLSNAVKAMVRFKHS